MATACYLPQRGVQSWVRAGVVLERIGAMISATFGTSPGLCTVRTVHSVTEIEREISGDLYSCIPEKSTLSCTY